MKIDRLWENHDKCDGVVHMKICGIIYGNLPSKANSRQIVTVGRPGRQRTLVIKSQAARDWEETFRTAVTYSASKLKSTPWPNGIPMELEVIAYYDSMRPDLEIELLKDAIQRAGVVENDRYFLRVIATRRVDRASPRVEFTIRRLAAPP